MDKKFFFFDVDNTLTVWPSRKIPASTLYCLRKLQEEGHRAGLATGRIQADAAKYAELAGVGDFVSDGGHSITIDNRLVEMESMDLVKCRALIAQLDEQDIQWAVTFENKPVRWSRFTDLQKQISPWDYFETRIDPGFDYRKLDRIYKIYVYMSPEEEALYNIDHKGLTYVRYGVDSMLFEPMDKARGICHIMDYYGLPYESVVVFGDGSNDVPMFQPQWFNVAMGNAQPELKALADYITDDSDQDGILNACRVFGWIKE